MGHFTNPGLLEILRSLIYGESKAILALSRLYFGIRAPTLSQSRPTLDCEFVCLTVCVATAACGCLTPKQRVRLPKRDNDLGLSEGRHVLHAPTLVRGQRCYRDSLDSALCVHNPGLSPLSGPPPARQPAVFRCETWEGSSQCSLYGCEVQMWGPGCSSPQRIDNRVNIYIFF